MWMRIVLRFLVLMGMLFFGGVAQGDELKHNFYQVTIIGPHTEISKELVQKAQPWVPSKVLPLIFKHKIGSYSAQLSRNKKERFLSTDSYADGGNIVLMGYDYYHYGKTSTTWAFEPTSTLNYFYLKNIRTGRCLTAKSQNLFQNHCQLNNQNQMWKISNKGVNISIHPLSNVKLCVESTSLVNGDKAQLKPCLPASKNQLWYKKSETNVPNPPHDSGKGVLCDTCNPLNPKCAQGGMCMITFYNQAICGQQCSQSSPCPKGYFCAKTFKMGKTFHQCAPKTYECSYEFVGP